MAGRGRPSKYSESVATEICTRIAQGYALREICSERGMPSASTVRGWVVDDREGFSERYARACQVRCEFWAEEMLEIADDGSNDWMERQDGDGKAIGWSVNGEAIQRSRVRIDTRKWLMSKLVPKFADKQTHELTGADGKDLQFNINLVRSGD